MGRFQFYFGGMAYIKVLEMKTASDRFINKMIFWKCMHCIGKPSMVYNWLWLANVRRKSGLTQREISRKLKLSAMYLCDIEKGRRRCPARVGKFYESIQTKWKK